MQLIKFLIIKKDAFFNGSNAFQLINNIRRKREKIIENEMFVVWEKLIDFRYGLNQTHIIIGNPKAMV